MNRRDVENYILDQARLFSANPRASMTDHIYKDLGIGGGDAVEFYSCLEERFGVDLHSITEELVDVPSCWFRKSSHRVVPRDPSLDEIVTFVIKRHYGDMA
jgi:hypothetical protein